MGTLKAQVLRYKLCFFSGIIFGILIGTTGLCILVSYRIDLFHKELASLENIIEDKNSRLVKLESTINTQELLLKDIEIFLLSDSDEMDMVDIEKSINEKYSSLLGKEVKNIDTDIIVEVIENRILKIYENEYQLHVKRLILSELLKIWIEVEKIS